MQLSLITTGLCKPRQSNSACRTRQQRVESQDERPVAFIPSPDFGTSSRSVETPLLTAVPARPRGWKTSPSDATSSSEHPPQPGCRRCHFTPGQADRIAPGSDAAMGKAFPREIEARAGLDAPALLFKGLCVLKSVSVTISSAGLGRCLLSKYIIKI